MERVRKTVESGSPLEPRIGFSRAVREGAHVAVSGTAPIGDDGTTVGQGDVRAQTVRCLDIAEAALREAGASLEDVVRTRIMLTDVRRWREAAQAHGERFASVRPACTFVEVSRFIDPDWLVEVDVDAIRPVPLRSEPYVGSRTAGGANRTPWAPRDPRGGRDGYPAHRAPRHRILRNSRCAVRRRWRGRPPSRPSPDARGPVPAPARWSP
ncbi:RidA family protein [Streptomyces sp. NPDC051776]|uniref:RidA family protein n=1 Tax=Streptomyces sp. NPDC051776 TaxID=3155414 RepID=UPI0034498AAA